MLPGEPGGVGTRAMHVGAPLAAVGGSWAKEWKSHGKGGSKTERPMSAVCKAAAKATPCV